MPILTKILWDKESVELSPKPKGGFPIDLGKKCNMVSNHIRTWLVDGSIKTYVGEYQACKRFLL